MRILGVDPGTLRTGIGLIETRGSAVRLLEARTVTVSPKTEFSVRLFQIYRELGAVVRSGRPEVLALENVFYGEDPKAMVKIGEARACAMLAAAEFGIPVREYAPGRVKQSVTGNGRATKDQIQKMVRQILAVRTPLAPDAADALAVALCHHHMGEGPAAPKKKGSGSGWSWQDLERLQQKNPRVRIQGEKRCTNRSAAC